MQLISIVLQNNEHLLEKSCFNNCFEIFSGILGPESLNISSYNCIKDNKPVCVCVFVAPPPPAGTPTRIFCVINLGGFRPMRAGRAGEPLPASLMTDDEFLALLSELAPGPFVTGCPETSQAWK